VKGLGQESLNLRSAESVNPIEQLENEDQVLSFHLEATGRKDQNKGSGDEEKDNETVQSTSFPPLEFLFIGREGTLKDFPNETENINSSLSNPILLRQGEDTVTQSDQPPVDEARVNGSGSGEGSPGTGNPKIEIPIERIGDTGILLKGADPNSGLNKVSLLSDYKDPVTRSDRLFVDEARVNGSGSGEGSPGTGNPKIEISIERTGDTGILGKGAGPDSGLNKVSFLSDYKDPVTQSDLLSVDGARVNGSGSGEGSPGTGNPKIEIPIERTGDTGILLKGADPNSGLNKVSLLSDYKDPVTQSDRLSVDGARVNGSESGEGRPDP